MEESLLTVGGTEKGYLFEFARDGVYLTVFPPEGVIVPFELKDLIKVLKTNGVDNYDVAALTHAAADAEGERKKVAPPRRQDTDNSTTNAEGKEAKSEEKEEGYCKATVEVTQDKMTARVSFDFQEGTKRMTPQMVKDVLQAAGVVYGLDEEAIAEGAKRGLPFDAAHGLAPQHGKNARLIKHFDLSLKGRPKIIAYDRVDHKDMGLFVLVKKGDLLAERVLQTDGTPGVNVLGKPINAKRGKPLFFRAGKNTVIKDENFLYADMDGQVVESGNSISVDPHLEIKGDVGVGTGNIDFDGSITITGDVQQGFEVKATGDVEVKGMVSGANIEAINVFISGGISGMSRGRILAHGDIRASFAERADLEAEHDIYISDVILHSRVQAGKHLFVAGRRGQIIGGDTSAGEAIEATQIGNVSYVATRLQVGVNPMIQRRHADACREYNESRMKLNQVRMALRTLDKIDMSALPPERRRQIADLSGSRFKLAGDMERNEQLIAELEEEMQHMKNGIVRVNDTLYPGVKLKINNIIKNVQTAEKHCTLKADKDTIRTGPY